MMARLVLSFLCLFSCTCQATTFATIDKILIVDYSMLVYVYPTGGVSNPPACHGSNGDYYSFSMTRPLAERYLDFLTTAYALKASVHFSGEQDCIDQSVSETLRYFWIED